MTHDELCRLVAYAQAKPSNERQRLKTIHCEKDGDACIAVASDGHRMATARTADVDGFEPSHDDFPDWRRASKPPDDTKPRESLMTAEDIDNEILRAAVGVIRQRKECDQGLDPCRAIIIPGQSYLLIRGQPQPVHVDALYWLDALLQCRGCDAVLITHGTDRQIILRQTRGAVSMTHLVMPLCSRWAPDEGVIE